MNSGILACLSGHDNRYHYYFYKSLSHELGIGVVFIINWNLYILYFFAQVEIWMPQWRGTEWVRIVHLIIPNIDVKDLLTNKVGG